MGCNLPADIQVVTEYEARWRPYMPVLRSGDQKLLEEFFTRLCLESPALDDMGDLDPFETYAMLLIVDVDSHTPHVRPCYSSDNESGDEDGAMGQ